MEKLRDAIASHDFPQLGQVTISIGVTELTRSSLPGTLIDNADRVLYAAKDAGRNQVQFFDPTMIDDPKVQKIQEDVFF
jgi:two-component system, cell cycle response regulator